MNKRVHFDLDEIARAVDRLQEARRGELELNDSAGAQARISAALLKPFALLMAAENNRGTTQDHVQQAMAAAIGNMLDTYGSSVGPGNPMMHARAVNSVMFYLAQAMQRMGKAADEDHVKIHPMQAGHA